MNFKGLIFGIPREILSGEKRVAAIPETVGKLTGENAVVLLEKGADPNVCNAAGKSPLHQAAGMGDTCIAKLLVERGADLNARYKGLTPGETAARGGHLAVERLLGENRPLEKKSSNF